MNLKETTFLWYVAVLRIYVGYYMLQQGIRKFHRDFPDPSFVIGTENEIMDQFRKTRDMIKVYCKDFVKENL